VILEGLDNLTMEQVICFKFETPKNQTDYETLIVGLQLGKELGVKRLNCESDSQLVTGQVKGEYQVKEPFL